ncbi:MAG: hypothetical protein ACT4TC_25485 [Myxococcaceae bacterium]
MEEIEPFGPGAPRCGATTLAGRPCPNPARVGRAFCVAHDPEAKDAQRAAAARGGSRRKATPAGPGQLTPEEIENVTAIATELGTATEPIHVRDAIAKTAALVLAGTIPPRVAAAVNQLANTTLRAISDDLSKELAELKQLLANHASTEVQGWAKRRRS